MKSGNLNFLEPSGPLQACNGTALPFTFCHTQCIDIRAARDSLAVLSKQFIIVYLECQYNIDSASLVVFCGSYGEAESHSGMENVSVI